VIASLKGQSGCLIQVNDIGTIIGFMKNFSGPEEGFVVAFLTTWSLLDGLVRFWQKSASLPVSSMNPDGLPTPEPEAASAHPFELLFQRMALLELNPIDVAREQPEIFIDLQAKCIQCTSRTRCEKDLREAADCEDKQWQGYCPNAATFSRLRRVPIHTITA
jgi:hypothetical protein